MTFRQGIFPPMLRASAYNWLKKPKLDKPDWTKISAYRPDLTKEN